MNDTHDELDGRLDTLAATLMTTRETVIELGVRLVAEGLADENESKARYFKFRLINMALRLDDERVAQHAAQQTENTDDE